MIKTKVSKRRYKKQIAEYSKMPAILQLKGNLSRAEAEEYSRQWREEMSHAIKYPVIMSTPPDLEVKMITPISPKRNRFLMYAGSKFSIKWH